MIDIEPVQPGQVWVDNDPRSKGRTLRIDSIEGTHAHCTIVTDVTRRPPRHSRVGMKTKIALARLRDTRTGYRLISQGESPGRWARPTVVPALVEAFPADVIDKWLPRMREIPEEFHKRTETSSDWYRWQMQHFIYGLGPLSGFIGVHLKPGIDGEMAFRHLGAVQGSYQPKHEHKMAGVAWLSSLWFDRIIYGDKTCPECEHMYETNDFECPECQTERPLSILGPPLELDEDDSKVS